MADSTLRIIPLGGLGEVGKNLTVFEANGEIIVVDSGLAFPRDEHLGVDLVLPDFTYLRERADRVRAVLLTHAHEDHVGSLPYLMREVKVPEVWGTRLTLGLLQPKLDEHGLLHATELKEARPEDGQVQIGRFRAEFIRMAHSVPDTVAIVLETGNLRVLHTGDYKIDHTPIDGRPTDLAKLARLGSDGVDLMLADSTNAERPGITQSEQLVAAALKRIIRDAPGRVIVTSFSSHIHRLQGVIDASEACGRKVAVVGRSMIKNLNIARNLGYADVEEGTLVKPSDLDELRDNEITVLCTGSQGEPMSALTRMAYSDHRQVQIRQGDTVIMSAKPVPGNELAVHDTMNALCRRGARVLHQDNEAVHVSGHGSAEELKMMLALVHPKAFMPVHGELRMLAAHAGLAESVGVPTGRIYVCDNGDVLVLERGSVRREGMVEAGVVFVDGLGIGDPKDAVLRDRRQLSADGTLIIVCQLHRGPSRVEPEVIARGFAPEGADAADELLDEVRAHASTILDRLDADGVREHKLLQSHLHDELAELVWNRARKRPLVLPVVVDV
jgi:ribonuclease J